MRPVRGFYVPNMKTVTKIKPFYEAWEFFH